MVTLTTIAGVGDVQISPTLALRNVLRVPKLSTNLVSIQKLTQDLGCNVTSYLAIVHFKTRTWGR
ncbi:hypothetical protein AAG906_029663 [Vitis piasezkii]